MKRIEKYRAKPFVKWVGGKTQLLEDIESIFPQDLLQRESVTYVEPFVGGGAVLFWILQRYPNITKAVINDVNSKLVLTYRVIRDNVEELVLELQRLQNEYCPLDENGRKEYYLAKRAIFNAGIPSEVESAALFIFLNRTCFNGLYRVNTKGKFNVPHGRYANPRICDADTLRADSELLKRVEILCGDFSQTACYAGEDTLYYFDPPYRPLTETAAFTSYSSAGFDDAEQIRLRDFCEQIASRNAHFVVSNSDPQNTDEDDAFFDNLYRMFSIKRVYATRMINSKGDGRGVISELMISNVPDNGRGYERF